MREILFRGKRIDNGEWIQGYLFKIWDDVFILWGTINGVPNPIQVDPKTIGQFTGLLDKNGVKIFDGDIIKDYSERLAPVYFEHGCFMYRKEPLTYDFEDEDNFCEPINTSLWAEVIGNIHDNPTLLKAEV